MRAETDADKAEAERDAAEFTEQAATVGAIVRDRRNQVAANRGTTTTAAGLTPT